MSLVWEYEGQQDTSSLRHWLNWEINENRMILIDRLVDKYIDRNIDRYMDSNIDRRIDRLID